MPRIRHFGIPAATRDLVLFKNDHACCICRVRGKHIQIHHIDGNRGNNNPNNLAVVCLDCHSRVTGPSGLGRSYSHGELRRYKRSWEQQVQESRGAHRPQIRYKRELISQIDIIVCEILALKPNNTRIEELFNLLYELHIWRGSPQINKKIIEGFGHLAIMGSFSSPRITKLVAENICQMCWHFVGPEYISSMSKRDVAQAIDCIEVLGTLAEFNCEFGHMKKAMNSIIDSAENFFEIGLWYLKKRIMNAVIHIYEEAIKNCYSEGQLEFAYGRRVLRRSLRNLQKMFDEEHLNWSHQRRRIQEVLTL